MSERSHVSMAAKWCPICQAAFETGEILLDTRIENGRLVQSLERQTIVGVDLCPEHAKKLDEGFVALFEVVGDPRQPTGNGALLLRSAAEDLFSGVEIQPRMLCEQGILQELQTMVRSSGEAEDGIDQCD